MINQENLKKMYEGIIEGKELTTKELNIYGFNSKDLSDLIKQGILERVKRGYYSFQSIDDLFYYGKKLIAEKEYEKATECFKKCYKLDPNHSDTCFQLFLRCISEKDYETAFKYFEVLADTDNPYYSADSNFYLYLLSIITDVPDKHKEYARYLKIEDIRVDFHDKRYRDIPQQNKIRIAVLQRKFPYALKQLKDLIAQHGSLTVQDIITRALLFQAVETETISKNTLLDLAKNKSYEEIAEYLEEKQKRHDLSLTDSYTLRLVNELMNIQESHQIPEKTVFQSEKLFEAIDGNNYELALNLSESYNNKNNINSSENTINLLLSDMYSLIKQHSLSTQKIVDVIEDELVVDPEEEILYEEPILTTTNLSASASFSDVIGFLVKSDLENAFRTLRNYMESINKKDYEFLIVDLIKLSLIEKDIAFTRPMIALIYVSRGKFKFDISNYIQEFYVTLAQNRFDEARIYLDIISKSNKLGQDCILTDGLLKVLNNAEDMIDYKRNNAVLDNVENALVKSQKAVSEPKVVTTPVRTVQSFSQVELPKSTASEFVVKQTPVVLKAENNASSIETRDNEKEFLESKHEMLLNGRGMILLKPMNSERRKRIHEMVKEYPDMVSFSIGDGENRQVVLRYRPFIDEYVYVRSLVKDGKEAYHAGNYEECIESYRRLLEFGEPNENIYSMLGLAYMKIGKIELAIDYLTVATELSKQNDNRYDYTELIMFLKGEILIEDKKTYVKMSTFEFVDDMGDNYGVPNVDEIFKLVESGISIKDACEMYELNEEDINIVFLIFAKNYYSEEKYGMGDKCFKTVEKSKNKTNFVKKLLNEVRKNKNFYKNRVEVVEKRLTLTPKNK